MSSYLESLIAKGYVLIPLMPATKRPLVSWAKYITTKPEPDTIKAWFGRWPRAEIGVLTGKLSNLMCLDYDQPPYPTHGCYTPTPRGGRHYFYQYTPGDRHGLNIRPGLDIPYIVKLYATPSINPGRMPITGSHEANKISPTSFEDPPCKPDMTDLLHCHFIKWFRNARNDSAWDGRYPLARAYASNVIRVTNPDLRLGNNYQHEAGIYSSLGRPISCRYIKQSGWSCPAIDASGLCTLRANVSTPYGLATKQVQTNTYG